MMMPVSYSLRFGSAGSRPALGRCDRRLPVVALRACQRDRCDDAGLHGGRADAVIDDGGVTGERFQSDRCGAARQCHGSACGCQVQSLSGIVGCHVDGLSGDGSGLSVSPEAGSELSVRSESTKKTATSSAMRLEAIAHDIVEHLANGALDGRRPEDLNASGFLREGDAGRGRRPVGQDGLPVRPRGRVGARWRWRCPRPSTVSLTVVVARGSGTFHSVLVMRVDGDCSSVMGPCDVHARRELVEEGR